MLKEYRIDHNLTQDQMAKKLGISISYYALLESGARQISARVAKSLKNLGIDTGYIEVISTNSIMKRIEKIKDNQDLMKELSDHIDELVKRNE